MGCARKHRGWIAVHTDITDRRQAEHNGRFLVQANEILAKPLEYQAILGAVAKLAVECIADWCRFDILGSNNTIRRAVVVHNDPGKQKLAEEMQERYPSRLDGHDAVAEVLRTGKPLFWEQIPPNVLKSWAQDDEHVRQLRLLGLKSAIIVPLQARAACLAQLTL